MNMQHEWGKAVKNRDIKQMEELLNKGVGVDTKIYTSGKTALYHFVYEYEGTDAERRAIYFLLENGADVNMKSEYYYQGTPFTQACMNGFLELVNMMMRYHADLNYVGLGSMHPLGLSIGNRNYEIARLLIKNGSKIVVENHYPYYMDSRLFYKNHRDFFEELFEKIDVLQTHQQKTLKAFRLDLLLQ
jgi:ankyrin repeat protein